MKARIPQGAGGAGNMNQMMQRMQKMQEEMTRAQAELEEKVYHVSAGGGNIEVEINGKKEVTSVTLKPEVVDPDDIEMLNDLIVAAVNEALNKADEETAAKMNKFTGGMDLGGLL